LAVDLETWRITQASVGIAQALGLPRQPLLGAALQEVIGAELLDAWVQSLGWGGEGRVPQRFVGQRVDPRGSAIDVVVQSAGSRLLIECQPRTHPYLGVDDTYWLEQLAQRVRATTSVEQRMRLLGEEARLLLQHCACQIWLPEERGRLLSPRWSVTSRHGPSDSGLPMCDATRLRRHPGRSMQARVIVDVQAEGRLIEGDDSALSDCMDQWHLALPEAGERQLMSALGARSAVFAQCWDGERLLYLLVAHSPEAVGIGLEAVGGIERLMLIEGAAREPSPLR
jgi:hypothetical protein